MKGSGNKNILETYKKWGITTNFADSRKLNPKPIVEKAKK